MRFGKTEAQHEFERLDEAVRVEHIASLPRWEYQVKRIGEDKQTGWAGSERMEQILNSAGADGWELVAIHAERATFKRLLPA